MIFRLRPVSHFPSAFHRVGASLYLYLCPRPPLCIITPNLPPLQSPFSLCFPPWLFPFPELPLHQRAFWVLIFLYSYDSFNLSHYVFSFLTAGLFAWVWRSGGCYATFDPPPSVMTT